MTRRYLKDDVNGREYLAYVSPNAVRYDVEDFVLLFDWLLEMRGGVGPVDPGASRSVSKGSKDFAHYEAWCRVAAEIDNRLARTHEDRLIAERYLYYKDELASPDRLAEYDLVMEAISKEIHRPVRKVHRALQSVLSYIASGPCPRWVNCVDCADYERCARRKHPPKKFLKSPRGVSYEEWKASRPGRREKGR
jgi:hypothetical protein